MFPIFPVNGDFLSSQWSVVIGIGLAFFMMQLALAVRFYLHVRRQDKILSELQRDFEQGGNGRGDLGALPQHFTWLRWVRSIFPGASTTRSGSYTRDDVLQELDTRIASNSHYLLLQRMGVMAPLLGVVLTVIGFYWLDVDDAEEQSLQSILLAVTPLVSGVGAGAVLALVNQALLHGVGVRVESLRMSARTWFDMVVWSHAGFDTQAATAKAVTAIEQFASSLTDSAGCHAASSDVITESTARMKDAASQFDEVVKLFNAEIKGIHQVLSDLRNVTAASADALKELIPMGSRAVANLDVSVAAFRTTIDREFAEAAKLHYRSSRVLAETVQHIADSTQLAALNSDGEQQRAGSNKASFRAVSKSPERQILTGNRQFYDAVQALRTEVATLNNSVRALMTNTQTIAGEPNQSTTPTIETDGAPFDGQMVDSAMLFTESADQLSARRPR